MTCELNESFDDALELDREEFARLFSRHARRIYAFIMTLVFSHHDAEEVFQNTSVVLWNKFGEFRPGSNFFAWASRIAYFEVLNLMKQQRRGPMLSDESLTAPGQRGDRHCRITPRRGSTRWTTACRG